MLIRCPTCASGYDLEPELLPEGQVLRCALCRDAWVHRAPAMAGPEIVAEAQFDRRPPAAREPAARRTPPRSTGRRPRPSQNWAASLLALSLIGGGMAAVAGKARLVAVFPPSEAVFATLGVPVNLKGLGIADLRSTVVSGEGPSTLTLDGKITNLRPDATAIPTLRIAVRDRNHRELYYWTTPAPKAQLAVGETVSFHSRLSAPPADGQDLAVSFAEPSAGPRRMAEVMPGDR